MAMLLVLSVTRDMLSRHGDQHVQSTESPLDASWAEPLCPERHRKAGHTALVGPVYNNP